MVSFACNVCQETIKKPKLDIHKQRCRYASYSCIDCGVDFVGTNYRSHTSCVSENEKYMGKLYKPKNAKQPVKDNKPQNKNNKSVQDKAKNTNNNNSAAVEKKVNTQIKNTSKPSIFSKKGNGDLVEQLTTKAKELSTAQAKEMESLGMDIEGSRLAADAADSIKASVSETTSKKQKKNKKPVEDTSAGSDNTSNPNKKLKGNKEMVSANLVENGKETNSNENLEKDDKSKILKTIKEVAFETLSSTSKRDNNSSGLPLSKFLKKVTKISAKKLPEISLEKIKDTVNTASVSVSQDSIQIKWL
ncbi:UPF0743 protein [Smittium culicis]|uniref:UPF0743 protein n=1 Tax=Smittium culicis TaxID=133412 RepID=A0A1R1XYQ1_9FUNG|nr:UPF0743 protein [Smittium culicis]OMJ19646.1 UPF0743 protein [Smittium culicis]